jgi:ribokinase
MEHIPRPGETILGGKFSMAAGGKGANQAVAAARAGGQVALLARVGRDMFGRQAIEGFRGDGIDVQHVLEDEQAPSGVALIFVAADGENSIGVASGANLCLSPADVQQAASVIADADVLVMQLETPLETVRAAATIAATHNVPVILNPAPAQPLDDPLLRLVSVLTPNESEAELLTGVHVTDEAAASRAADDLRARGVRQVIVTLGSRGAWVSAPQFRRPRFPSRNSVPSPRHHGVPRSSGCWCPEEPGRRRAARASLSFPAFDHCRAGTVWLWTSRTIECGRCLAPSRRAMTA